MKPERLPWLLAGLTLVMHAVGNPHYGFFRDELYFIICGRHPQLGYVDQPPLVPLTAALTQVFGHSLFLLRLVPALCAAAAVYVTCLLVMEFGGGTFAMILGSMLTALSAVLVNFGMKASPDEFQMVLWPLTALYVLRAVKRRDPLWWLWAGVSVGAAAEAKYSVVFFAVALLVGVLLTPERSTMRDRWFGFGVLAATLIAIPNFLWQAYYHFPMIELLVHGQQGKNVVYSPLLFVLNEILIANPFFVVLWGCGLVWLFRNTQTRWLGYTFVILLAIMIAAHAKPYYPSPIFPIVFAAAGYRIDKWIGSRWLWRPAIAIYVAVAGALLLPLVLPILPPANLVAYMRLIHLAPAAEEHHKMRELPQDYADMMGWPEMTRTVARVYDALPAADRARAVILADNYGEASAINFFGPAYGLPPAISGHNQYYLWGPQGYDGSVVIKIGGDPSQLRRVFRSVRYAARIANPMGMAYEDRLPVYVCRDLSVPLGKVWPKLKDYN